jgi:hypothetical protein
MTKYIESNIPEDVRVCVYYQHDDTGRIDSTVCVLEDKETHKALGVGRALTSPKEKSPNRKMGRAIAVGRAFKDMEYFKFTSEYSGEDEPIMPYIDWEKLATS